MSRKNCRLDSRSKNCRLHFVSYLEGVSLQNGRLREQLAAQRTQHTQQQQQQQSPRPQPYQQQYQQQRQQYQQQYQQYQPFSYRNTHQ